MNRVLRILNNFRLLANLSQVRTLSCSMAKLQNRIDYYTALGVTPNADGQTIKTAYFRLAKKYHPDFNSTPSATSLFEMISEAYEVLSDPAKRKNYDETGTPWSTKGGTTSYGPGRARSGADKTFSSEDLFSKFSREEGVVHEDDTFADELEYNRHSHFGEDTTRELIANVTFEEAASGCIFNAQVNQKIVCFKCQGTKNEWGFQGKSCVYCEGTGYETDKVGLVMTRKPCAYCEGTGVFIKFKCTECAGTGITIFGIIQKIYIPPGTEDGEILRVPYEESLKVASVEKLDYFPVKVVVEPSKAFARKGLDLFSKTDIDVDTAVYGGEIEVQGIGNTAIKILVPPGTSSHQKLTVPGHGIHQGGQVGNLFVEIGINTEIISEECKQSLGALARDFDVNFDKQSTTIITPLIQERTFEINSRD